MSCSTSSSLDNDLKPSEMPLSTLQIQPVALNRSNFTLPVEIQLKILPWCIDNIVEECAGLKISGKGMSSATRQIRAILHALPGLRSEVTKMLVTKKAAAAEEMKAVAQRQVQRESNIHPDILRLMTKRSRLNLAAQIRFSREAYLLAHLIVIAETEQGV